MANKIILKKTSTASKVPLSTDLEVGEIAVNLADQKLYSKNAGGTVVLVGNGQATGTVTSVGITPSTGVTVSGSPVTTSGNITVGLSTKLTAIENLSGAGFITQNGSGAIAGRTIQAGTGISVAHGNGSSQDPVITNSDLGSSQNIFKNIAVSGQSTVVADSNNDTVTLANGTGVSITTNATTDTITFTNNGVTSFSAGTTGLTPSTGTTGSVTLGGTLAIANGGTGATSRQEAMDALAGAVISGQYLRGNGTDVVMSAIQAGDVPTLNQNTTGSAGTLTTGRTIAITGDLAYTSGSFNGSANVTGTGTLATVNSNVGTYGSSTSIPVVTVNAKGLVTAVSTATVAGGQYFGSATVKAIAYNANSIGENVTVTTGNNGLSAGPITINTGFTVTVQTGANWVIV
jgi:hypothetical protein